MSEIDIIAKFIYYLKNINDISNLDMYSLTGGVIKMRKGKSKGCC